MQDTLIFIQARLTSNRLPNKVISYLKGETVINHVYKRCAQVAETVVLIPNNKENDELSVELKSFGAKYFRGAEHDVLMRFYEASKKYQAKNYVRITADCPLISSDVIDIMIRVHRLQGRPYTSNGYPVRKTIKGMDVEVFTREALEQAHTTATEPYDREHVTPWMRRNLRVTNIPSLALDTEEDYEFLRRVME